MIRRPPRSTPFPTRRSSDLLRLQERREGARPPRRADRELHGEAVRRPVGRSEEHTSELQSRQYLVSRLLLEKKKTIKQLIVYPHLHTNFLPGVLDVPRVLEM